MAHAVAAVASADATEFPVWRRSVAFIGLGAGMASFSMNFWVPFLPLYMQELGAGSQARALFWVAVGMSANGVTRILGGPFWGVLADRYGRKPMFVRALFGATATTLIAVIATEPWHVAAAWACQGFFSGFIPAAVALTSVSVPRSKLATALGTVQGSQYIGTTVGPALGAVMAEVAGLRGAILTAALMPAIAATIALIAIPRDRVTPRTIAADGSALPPTHWTTLFRGPLARQLVFGLILFFALFMMGQLVRLATPTALGNILQTGSATRATGIAFSVSGLASVIGAFGLARLINRAGWLRRSILVALVGSAVVHGLLALAGSVWLYTLWFSLAALAQGAVLPASNTIIAASAPPERRGTAFGIASSVQALSFIVGPMGAALFAATSLQLGFLLLAALLLVMSALTFVLLREPDLESSTAAPSPPTEGPERRPTRAPA